MSTEKNIDLLRRDECQPMETAQMESAKAQIRPRNRANVNIVPYEIYDEDEHIVGEWRETISGVKKKKPVYEKRLHGQAPNNSSRNTYPHGIQNVEYIWVHNYWFAWSSQDFFESSGGCYPTPVVGSANSMNAHVFVIDGVTPSNIGIWANENHSNCSWTAFVRYTKTTDEWEEVDE